MAETVTLLFFGNRYQTQARLDIRRRRRRHSIEFQVCVPWRDYNIYYGDLIVDGYIITLYLLPTGFGRTIYRAIRTIYRIANVRHVVYYTLVGI